MVLIQRLNELRSNKLLRSTLTVAAFGFMGKLVSMIKEVVIAARFGVGREMDIFNLASTIVNFTAGLLAGNVNVAFTPVFASLEGQERQDDARRLFWVVGYRLMVGLLALGLLMGLSAPFWIPYAVQTWDAGAQTRLSEILGLLLLTVPLSGGTVLVASAVQYRGQFTLPALCQILNPLAVLAVLQLPLAWGAFQISGGVVLGATLEFLVLFWFILRILPRPAQPPTPEINQAVRSVWKLLVPSLGAGLFMSTTTLVDMLIAAWLPVGAASMLGYASKLPGVVITLSAGALSTTVFPAFSRLAGLGHWTELRQRGTRIIVYGFLIASLAALLLSLLSPWLVRVFFMHGAFGPEQAAAVSSIQSIYFLQIPFYVCSVLSVRLIQALRRHKINFYGTIMNAVLNLTLDLAFLPFLKERGIALSTVVVYAASMCFLAFWAYRTLSRLEASGATELPA